MKKNKIIIIGGGYAGIRALEKLSKDKSNEITLLDDHPYHYMQTEVYGFIANENDFSKITVDLFTLCAGFGSHVAFCKQKVTSIDFDAKKVLTHEQSYDYDYVIVAVGSRTKFFDSIVGLKKYAHGIKALFRALYFKQKFELSLFNKIEEEGTYCKALNIIVAGAGLSGVEIAAQMASFSRDFYKENNFLCRKLTIVLIDACERILPGIDDFLVEASIKRLHKLEVIIKDGRKVVEVTENSVSLSSGEVLPMDFMIFTGGVEPKELVYDLDVPKDRRGHIAINEYMQIQGYENAYAIGDCTAIYNDGILVAPTADVAEQMAELCAKNIRNSSKNKKLEKVTIKSRGILIALGRGYAVGKIFGFYVDGYLGYLLKKVVEKVYSKRLFLRSGRGSKKIFSKGA
ncbi:MAG: FAD-dependent oxidoreductase [Sulfurimonas sp.]|nr:FAD-dependent oxidoreductase [Sulfurimonas sp.]MDD5202111.1 FAD-dependent oxidoreductase [Sulfurimonas sp.]